MFECLICKNLGISVIKRNLVPHILRTHSDLENGTATYMEMFPEARLREAPKTCYSNKEFRDKCVEKSCSKRVGKKLSAETVEKMMISRKSSQKFADSRKLISEKYKSGEIKNPKEKILDEIVLRKLYLEDKLSTNQIGKILGCSKRIVRKYLDKFLIEKRDLKKSLHAYYKKHEHNSLTNNELDVIIGEILGDGCLRFNKSKEPSYTQSCKYIDFLIWIKSLLPNVPWSKNEITISKEPCKDRKYYFLNSRGHQDFLELKNKFYCFNSGKNKNIKKIPKDLKLNSTILLHWFLGDGHCCIDKNNDVEVVISAFDFEEEDLNEIIIPQMTKMGINARVKVKKEGPMIRIYANSYENFYKKIGPVSPVPCYDYKFKLVGERFPSLLCPKKDFPSIDQSFKKYRTNGFPFHSIAEENKKNIFEELKKVETYSLIENDVIKSNRTGLKLCNYYHSQIYFIKSRTKNMSIMDVFMDDNQLKTILVELSSKYGMIRDSDVRSRCRFEASNMITNFRPSVAKFIVEQYSNKNSIILDPFSGFGGRLLGTMACDDRKYIGIDVEYPMIENSKRMSLELGFSERCELLNQSFESYCGKENNVDLILSSPPYFDLERYNSENKEQSYIKYPEYSLWKDNFLTNIVEKGHNLLKYNGFLCINFKNTEFPIADDFFNLASKKFTHIATYKIECDRFAVSAEKSEEPIFIFQKKN